MLTMKIIVADISNSGGSSGSSCSGRDYKCQKQRCELLRSAVGGGTGVDHRRCLLASLCLWWLWLSLLYHGCGYGIALKAHIDTYENSNSNSSYVYIYIYTYIHTHTHTYTYIHVYIYIYKYTHIRTYTHTHVYLSIYIYIYIYMYTHTYTHIYIYTHIHVYIYTRVFALCASLPLASVIRYSIRNF